MKKRNVSMYAGGGGPAEPVLSKQSELADDVKSNAKGREPAPVRASETGRARNWTMPPLRLERECKERPNSATIDNRCEEFDRRESTESTAIIGLRALGRRIAFTMAEILLSLTIIGVVAAITLPSLTGNINERTWNTQRKALYARFSQAIALMPALNGYGTLREMSGSAGSTSIEDTAAETFVTAGLSKVLKINNICDGEHLADCGIPDKITPINGGSAFSLPKTLVGLNSMFNGSYSTDGYADHDDTGILVYSQTDTKVAAFETQNGESIAVYYNPNCAGDLNDTSAYFSQPKMCANFVYDLNGSKGPNTVGKDIGFITALYPSDAVVVAPMPLNKQLEGFGGQISVGEKCKELDSESRLPNKDELASMFYNRKLLGEYSPYYWSSTVVSTNDGTKAWLQYFTTGRHFPYGRNYNGHVWCVKR